MRWSARWRHGRGRPSRLDRADRCRAHARGGLAVGHRRADHTGHTGGVGDAGAIAGAGECPPGPHRRRASEGATVSLLLSLGSPDAIRGFADAVLAPLDHLDPRERLELLRTLDQWLRVNGAWDPAAARLSLHRNTVRNRIERIAQLTGRRLDDGDDRMELWLALKARAAVPQ